MSSNPINEGNIISVVRSHDVLLINHGKRVESLEERAQREDVVWKRLSEGSHMLGRALWALVLLGAAALLERTFAHWLP